MSPSILSVFIRDLFGHHKMHTRTHTHIMSKQQQKVHSNTDSTVKCGIAIVVVDIVVSVTSNTPDGFVYLCYLSISKLLIHTTLYG